MAVRIGVEERTVSVGVNSLAIAMTAGACGRICFGMIADRIGPLPAYATASTIQTLCVLAFPVMEGGVPFMFLSAVSGFGFAGNMPSLAVAVRQAVPACRFGGALGVVMMIVWIGMAAGAYLGGVSFEIARSYGPAFMLAGAAGALNLTAIGILTTRQGAGRVE